jgi:hypothetical protein
MAVGDWHWTRSSRSSIGHRRGPTAAAGWTGRGRARQPRAALDHLWTWATGGVAVCWRPRFWQMHTPPRDAPGRRRARDAGWGRDSSKAARRSSAGGWPLGGDMRRRTTTGAVEARRPGDGASANAPTTTRLRPTAARRLDHGPPMTTPSTRPRDLDPVGRREVQGLWALASTSAIAASRAAEGDDTLETERLGWFDRDLVTRAFGGPPAPLPEAPRTSVPRCGSSAPPATCRGGVRVRDLAMLSDRLRIYLWGRPAGDRGDGLHREPVADRRDPADPDADPRPSAARGGRPAP